MWHFVAECRRRRVFRVAALYIVGSWIVLQVADLAFNNWGVPAVVMRSVWIGLILGFPVALVFGWRFDLDGARIRRTVDVSGGVDLALRRSDFLILSALALVIIAILSGIATKISSTRIPTTERIVAEGLDPHSIAVLPFTTISSSEDQTEFLADGIQEDLLTRLSKIETLTVISQKSADRYLNTTKSIPTIGKELGVATLLEGSVRRSGAQLRVSVQMINAATDENLWAESFDRRLTAADIFGVQTEIVEKIARRLQANITQEEAQQLVTLPTENLEAFTAYLKGRKLSDVETLEALNRSIEQLNQAIKLDPGFALAYVGLADVYLTLGANFFGGLPLDESIALAEPPLTRALELDGNLGEAFASLGFLRQQQGDFQAAEQAYDRAISLQPSYARVYRLYGRLRRQQQRPAEAMEMLERALSLDPYSALVNFDLARSYDESGQFDEALERYYRVIEIEPDYALAYAYIAAIHYLVFGSVDESLIWYHKAALNDPSSPSLQAVQAFGYLELGDPATAKLWVDKGSELGPRTYWPLWASMMWNLYQGNAQAAQLHARIMLELYPQNWTALRVLRDADLAAGRLEAARSRYATAFREYGWSDEPEIDAYNYKAAVDYAAVLIKLGQQELAERLLEKSLALTQSMSRSGVSGFYSTDIQIYALQNRTQQAITALRQAIDDGWRYLVWYHLGQNPNLESIRALPGFQSLYAEIRADLAAQGSRIRELQDSGELEPVPLRQ